MTSWINNHELFLKELATGNKWAAHVAEHLNSVGISCYTPESKIRKNISEISSFSENEKDIVFTEMSGHLEVKSRALAFNKLVQSYPYDTAFVDTVSGWEKKLEKPLAVILVSQKTSSMLYIPVNTSHLWSSERKYDRVRGITDTWLTVDKKHLLPMSELVSFLKNKVDKNS
jgi:hypothetical protein